VTTIFPAVLLLGPTGSGKTPLGDTLEAAGLAGRRSFHLDFGAELRAAAASPARVPGLTAGDLAVVRSSLATGALLEDEEFPVALKIVRAFIERNRIGGGELLVLNGLPRHAGQARLLEGVVDVRTIVVLEAPAEVVLARIRSDAAGDRAGRVDDGPEAIERKLAVYAERARPLVGHYAAKGIPIVRIPVDAADDGRSLLRKLAVRTRSLGPRILV
jgi:adenylate kinase family enzyme